MTHEQFDYYEATAMPDLTGKTKEQLETLVSDLQCQIDILNRSLKEKQLTLDIKTREAEKAMRVVEFFMDTAAMGKMILEGW